MIRILILSVAIAAIALAGCGGGDEGVDPNAGKGPVKEGAGETKGATMPNDSGP